MASVFQMRQSASVSPLILIALGVFLIGTVLWSWRDIRPAWCNPARWWKTDEYTDSRSAAQPFNVLAGLVLGIAALAYGVVWLIN